jgi:predicted DNA-binding transcriptional regulator
MNPNRLSVESILQALAVDKSLVLFNTIALASTDTEILMKKLALSRKQYYSKMSALLRAGLVKRRL